MQRLIFAISLLSVSAVAFAAPTETQLAIALHDVTAEELVFDASWKDTVVPVLDARMFDNGTGRNGYAGYLCMVLSESQITGGVVRVLDVASSEERLLGQATCK